MRTSSHYHFAHVCVTPAANATLLDRIYTTNPEIIRLASSTLYLLLPGGLQVLRGLGNLGCCLVQL
jgi:hypothetical protein